MFSIVALAAGSIYIDVIISEVIQSNLQAAVRRTFRWQ